MWCERYPACGCGTQSGPHACEADESLDGYLGADPNAARRIFERRNSRPSADPPGFDRDGLATGPTRTGRCPDCGAPPKQDHAYECSTRKIKPQPIAAGAVYSDRCRNSEPTDLAD